MTFPYITAITAGLILILQMLLGFTVSAGRGQIGVGDGGKEELLRKIRRHANLAENAGIFVAGFMLLELSKFSTELLIGICSAFVIARVFHAAGLSRQNTINAFRLIGALLTYLIGLVLGGSLLWVGFTTAVANRTFG